MNREMKKVKREARLKKLRETLERKKRGGKKTIIEIDVMEHNACVCTGMLYHFNLLFRVPPSAEDEENSSTMQYSPQ